MTSKTTGGARRWSVSPISVVGWLLLSCGVAVLLYLAYSLLFTNVAADRAQSELRQQWETQLTGSDTQPAASPSAAASEPARDRTTALNRGVALIEFVRPGSPDPPVHADPLVVLNGVTVEDLRRGPGRYPNTALPGRPGNFAVAGPRTTYGAPFFHLDALRRGDEILVTDRRGRRYTYRVKRQQVVAPDATWVIEDDPLGTGRPMLTLTTCNPRFSAAERLVVHAELVS